MVVISYYEQILDEDKDIQPLLISKKKIENFIQEFPNTDYTIDLKFKLDLVINQLAAKEKRYRDDFARLQRTMSALNDQMGSLSMFSGGYGGYY